MTFKALIYWSLIMATDTTSTGKKTNLKTFVLSTILAPLTAIETKLNSVIAIINASTGVQNSSILNLQKNITTNHGAIADNATRIMELREDVDSLKKTQYSQDQLNEMIRRNRELSWICTQLHTIVYEISISGSSNRPLPDLEHPIVTRQELELKFREQYDIPAGSPLTEEQEEQFANFIVQWFIDNPGHVLDEDVPSNM